MTLPTAGFQTRLLHADHPDAQREPNYPLAPSMSLSTTFHVPHPDFKEEHEAYLNPPENSQDTKIHVYSRYTHDTMARTEQVLTSLLGANALTYSSGLNAIISVLNHYAPSVIAIRNGYQGTHASIELYTRGRDVRIIDLDDEYPKVETTPTTDGSGVKIGGLLVWLETPLNPTGEARDIAHYAKRAHEVGGYLGVDSTFAPPPLQDPFKQGADIVMHSATKYMGGHSDLLAGVVAVKDVKEFNRLWHDRTYLGTRPGGLELYLLLRSLRTLGIRVARQSENAEKLAKWLHSLTEEGEPSPETPQEITGGRVVRYVWHTTLQPRDGKNDPRGYCEGKDFDPSSQMTGGPPTFSFWLRSEAAARILGQKTTYFQAATSLGGVESLLEHRWASNRTENPHVCRISTGIEDFEDLRADLQQAFVNVASLS
ncbi:cystathionine gamma-synthase [Malassezia cuniculi]|uniref:Cystathionine gamma-synthase n=1 Tax=Malassezia cuniculi TaxID=948313 RepID=A0AAF0ETW6_9BASI|nr:cystathionine gamma-synthase [Malassezia cuniculi]